MPEELYAVWCSHLETKVVQVRLTKATVVPLTLTYRTDRFHLHNGKVMSDTCGPIFLNFLDDRTSKRVREAHELRKAELFDKYQEARRIKREDQRKVSGQCLAS